MKKILALSTALVLALSVLCVGALADLNPTDVVGTWYLNSIEGMGISMNPASLGMDMAIVLNEDNTAFAEMADEDESPTGSWAIVAGQVIVTMDGDDLALTLTGGNLVAEEDGMAMIFGREKAQAEADEASPIRTDATLSDFNGTWEAYIAEYEMMKLPVEMFGLEVIVALEDGKGIMTTFGIDVEIEGAVDEGILTVTGNDSGEAVSLSFFLHEDGTLSCAFQEDVTLYFKAN